MLQQLYMATKGMASKYTLHRPNHKKESYAYEQWISGKHHAKLTSFITVSFRLSSFSASVKQSLFMSIVGDESSGDRRGRLLRRSSGTTPPAIVGASSGNRRGLLPPYVKVISKLSGLCFNDPPIMSKLYRSYRGYVLTTPPPHV